MTGLLIVCGVAMWTVAIYILAWDQGFQDAKDIYNVYKDAGGTK